VTVARAFVASKDIKAAERSAFEDEAIWQRFILMRQNVAETMIRLSFNCKHIRSAPSP
jgi:hypothetical protein